MIIEFCSHFLFKMLRIHLTKMNHQDLVKEEDTEVCYSITATSDYHTETLSRGNSGMDGSNGFSGKYVNVTLEGFVEM